MQDTIQQYSDMIVQYATVAGLKILAVIIFWLVGRWLCVLPAITIITGRFPGTDASTSGDHAKIKRLRPMSG